MSLKNEVWTKWFYNEVCISYASDLFITQVQG